jgi:AcrR family transcriptional regulator
VEVDDFMFLTSFVEDDDPPPSEVHASTGTRDAIVQAAHRCIRRYGIRRTTMEEVARMANLSRGAVYRYFPDKDALVQEVLVSNGHRVRDQLAALLDGADSLDTQVALAARFAVTPRKGELLLDLGETEPEALALMLTVHAQPWIERATRFWEPYIRKAQRRNEVRADLDTSQAAEWVARSLYSLAITPTVTVAGDRPDDVGRFAATFVLGGLRPPEQMAKKRRT